MLTTKRISFSFPVSITKVEFKNRKPHLRYDTDKKVWIGHRIDVRVGKKRYRNTFRTKGEAERFIDDLRARKLYRGAGLKYMARADVPLRELFRKRLEQLTNPKEIVRATRIFDLFEGSFEYPPAVTAVRSAHIQNYINERLATGVKPETVDREITIISSALRQAPVLFTDALEEFEPPRVPRPKYKKRKKKKRVITESEKDLIIKAILSDRLARENEIRTRNRQVTAWIFEIGWLLGFRFSEVLGLLKTDFNKKARSLRVMRWKTDTVSTLNYLPGRVMEIVIAASESSKSGKIFDLTCSEHTFTDMIGRACRANGITYGRAEMDGVTFHSTRHSFTSRLVQVTDIATAGEYTGHSSSEMVDYYSHPSEESKRLAMERLYGNGRATPLAEIYEKVRSGEMDLADFIAALK